MNSKKVLDVILIIIFILMSAIGGYLWYDYKLLDVEYEESVKVGEEISVKKYLLPDEKTNLNLPLKTPRAGFEPATNRLTADRSTAELPRITTLRTYPCQLPKGK